MVRTLGLLPASWKGIPFYVRNEVMTEGGRRIVLHDYPNSNERFVEDMGQLPPKFSITAFVTGPDFLDRAMQLERSLNEEGAGRLSMPSFGAMTLFALPYKKDASQKSVGEIKFDLEFVAGRAISGPSIAPITVQTVFSLGDTARIQIGLSLSGIWISGIDTANVITAQYDLRQFTAAAWQLKTIVSNPTTLASIVGFIDVNAPSIVRDGVRLADAFINGLWQNVSVGLSGGAGFSATIELSRYGSDLSVSLADIRDYGVTIATSTGGTDIPLWDATTAGRITRNRNRLSLVNAGRVASLVTAYEQAADASYRTDVDIEETRALLESNHERLMRVDTEDAELIQSQQAVRRAVEDMRLAVLDVLDQKEQAAFSLVDVDLNAPSGSFTLAYDLYAETMTTGDDVTARGIEVRGLNPNSPADKLHGDSTVLQSR